MWLLCARMHVRVCECLYVLLIFRQIHAFLKLYIRYKQMQVMAANGTIVNQKLPANFSKSIEQADMQMGFVTSVEWKVRAFASGSRASRKSGF
jgi:hypothetical protein